MTEVVTEMPRACSIAIQSEVAWRLALRPLTVPAIWIAPPNSSSFSVSVVLPASGWEIIANVRRCSASAAVLASVGMGWGVVGTGDLDSKKHCMVLRHAYSLKIPLAIRTGIHI